MWGAARLAGTESRYANPHGLPAPIGVEAGGLSADSESPMTKTLLMTYDGHSIQFNDNGWFNATHAAEKFGKRPVDWFALDSTKEYVAVLCDALKCEESSLYTARKGKNGGTWMHPKLGVAFARWLDVRFAVWCDTQIETIIHGVPEAQDWHRMRHEAASSFKVMSDVMLEKRTEDGKETLPYHYANEAKLVNWALTGEFKPLDRNALSSEDLDTLAKLEARNAVLLAKGANRELRKELLMALVENRRAKLALVRGGAA